MEEHRLCALDDLKDGGGKSFEAGGVSLAVFRIGGEVFCVENVCPHNGAQLHDGILGKDDKTILCRWHFIAFDLQNGDCIGNPRCRAVVYPLDIRDGEVFVRLEDGR